MRSFRSNPSTRRQTYLRLAGEIESQLRDAYARQHAKGITQSSLAEKLDINRSAVHHRLMGQTNMTTETIADMVWALKCKISVRITDAEEDASTNEFLPPPPQARHEVGTTDQVAKSQWSLDTAKIVTSASAV